MLQTTNTVDIKKAIVLLELLYKHSLRTGRLAQPGLCNTITKDLGVDFLAMFKWLLSPSIHPPAPNFFLENLFWGFGGESAHPYRLLYEFTPLRQTLLLLFIEYLKIDYDGDL